MAEKTNICQSCFKSFPPNLFLRHVSHKDNCKDHYKNQMESLKTEGRKFAQEKTRANRYKAYDNADLNTVECEKCTKTFLRNTLMKHLVKSQDCKAFYGSSRIDRMKKELECAKKSKQYHDMSKDQKAAIMVKQRERRARLEKEKKEKEWEEAKERNLKLAEEFKVDRPKKVKLENKLRLDHFQKSFNEWEKLKVTQKERKMLLSLEEKAKKVYEAVEEKVAQVMDEVKHLTDSSLIAEKYDDLWPFEFWKVQYRMVIDEWNKVGLEINSTIIDKLSLNYEIPNECLLVLDLSPAQYKIQMEKIRLGKECQKLQN